MIFGYAADVCGGCSLFHEPLLKPIRRTLRFSPYSGFLSGWCSLATHEVFRRATAKDVCDANRNLRNGSGGPLG
jgi:hypothetical protein